MKRLITLSVVSLVVVSCAEQSEPPAGLGRGPALLVSDGAHGGNGAFYFLPPLVETPSFGGVFFPGAEPTVVICELATRDQSLVTPATACTPVTTFAPSQISVDPTAQAYQVNWQTGTQNGILYPNLYRIEVYAAGRRLGFRDVAPKDSPTEVPRNPETEAFYAFLNGNTRPIKFRIEEGFICEDLIFDDIKGECNEGNLANGILVQIPETGTGVSIPPQKTLSGFVALIIEPCLDANGNPAELPIDLPRYGPCFEVRTEPLLTQTLDSLATVFICEALSPPHRVQELIRLHSTEALDGSDPVEALPNAPGFCPSELARSTEGASWLQKLAWSVTDRVRSVFVPRPLYATTGLLDRGRGGLDNGFSFFQFALPAKMSILAGNNQVARAGTAVPVNPAVRVTDLDDSVVAGATVHFDVITGNGTVVPASVVTGTDGIARVSSWTLGNVGLNQLRAWGRGIADPVTNGPRPTFDPFTPIQQPNPYDEVPVTLQTGELIFNATACGDGFGTIAVDGVLDPAWACAQVDVTFSANLSGSSGTPARWLVINDGTTLYMALVVRRSAADKINVLTVEFDHNGNGMRDEGEDVLEVESDGITTIFRDMFVTAKCAKSNSAACGDADVTAGGTRDGTGAFRNDGTFSIWEISHPLNSGDAAHDFSKSKGQMLGGIVYLRFGQGAQGKTEFPANRVPLVFTIK